MEFLDSNRSEDNWFLQIETFDPHEPFYSMDHYKALYPHHYEGPQFDWPDYSKVTESPEAVQHVRYEYAALLSMCDANLGRLLDYMDKYAMWDDTMLIVNTDHGYLLGEHDSWAKCVHPLYNENVLIPFFIWDPRSAIQDERRQSLVQTIDIAPTILDFFKIPIPLEVMGKPLSEVLAKDEQIHEAVLFGIHGGQMNITDGRYVYMRNYVESNQPLFNYTHFPTHMRSLFSVEEMQTLALSDPFSFTRGCKTMKLQCLPGKDNDIRLAHRHENTLYDVVTDPKQEHPIQNAEIENRMIQLIIKLMQANDSPSEQYVRLGLAEYL